METGVMADRTTDGERVAQLRQGDISAFSDLYHRHARLIRALCYDRTGDLHQAQDMAQEVFLRAYRKINELREPSKFLAWLVAIVSNVGREWLRGKIRDRHQYMEHPPERTSPPTQEAVSMQSEQLTDLREAIRRLPDNERTALYLFYMQQRPVEDARLLLGLSRSGFYQVLERARTRLKKMLNEEDQS